MTNEERKVLSDMKYELECAFLYNNKRLNKEQKGALERAFKTLRKVFDDDMKRLLSNPEEARKYFEYVGIKL